MKISFTHHAKHRIMERNISVENIRKTIKNPNFQKNDKHGMITVRKLINNRNLEVIFKIVGSNYIIITAYYEN